MEGLDMIWCALPFAGHTTHAALAPLSVDERGEGGYVDPGHALPGDNKGPPLRVCCTLRDARGWVWGVWCASALPFGFQLPLE